MSNIYFSSKGSVDVTTGVISDAIVCMEGEAKSHGFMLTGDFLKELVRLANAAGPIKVRCNHPGQESDVLSIVGEASEFALDTVTTEAGEEKACVRAGKISLFDVTDPATRKLITLADKASHLFGLSLDFVGQIGKKLKNGLKTISCTEIRAVDFVDRPAATEALFSADAPKSDSIQIQSEPLKVYLNPTNADLSIFKPEDQSDMSKVTKLEEGDKEVKKDSEPAEPTMSQLCKMLSDHIAKFDAYMSADKEDKGDKEDAKAEPAMSAKLSTDISEAVTKAVETAVTAKVTAKLAQVGTQEAKASLPVSAPEPKNEFKLSEDQKAWAVKLGIKEEDYANQLKAYDKTIS